MKDLNINIQEAQSTLRKMILKKKKKKPHRETHNVQSFKGQRQRAKEKCPKFQQILNDSYHAKYLSNKISDNKKTQTSINLWKLTQS